jgi:hypothetical protein
VRNACQYLNRVHISSIGCTAIRDTSRHVSVIFYYDTLPLLMFHVIEWILNSAGNFKGDPGIESLKQRIEALRVLDQSIGSAVRLGDAQVIHDGCTLVWNLSLPLLQSYHRHHVHRVFKTCVYALESVDSPLHQLRVQFHVAFLQPQNTHC